MYNSAFACVICAQKGDHIHHIDKNNSNNSYDNLVLLCQEHHDEAHTIRELSLTLTPERLRSFKAEWCKLVIERRNVVASASGQKAHADGLLSVGVAWGYINHSRIIQTVPNDLLKKVDQNLFARLKIAQVIDERGILIKPRIIKSSSTHLGNTIYDWYDYGNRIALHIFYSNLVDIFVEYCQPIHLDETNWKRTFVKQMIAPGSFIFINRAQYFRKTEESIENAEIAVQTFKRGIKIEYLINTRNMYGTTSITCSFSGHKSCASLLLVKSIEDRKGECVIYCTPIALGVGFRAKTPIFLFDKAHYHGKS